MRKRVWPVYRLDYFTIESNLLRKFIYDSTSSLVLLRKKDTIYDYVPTTDYRDWNPEQEQYLKDNFDQSKSTISKQQIADTLGKTFQSVHCKAVRLNLLKRR